MSSSLNPQPVDGELRDVRPFSPNFSPFTTELYNEYPEK
jgi:hypothetical protein